MPPMPPQYQYESIPDSSSDDLDVEVNVAPAAPKEESPFYVLSKAFKILSATVWFSMSVWGIWISIFYTKAAAFNWNNFNIVFPDMYTKESPVASFAIAFHLIGAAFMAVAGAFQLVKYIRKTYPVFHRWVGRIYIVSSLIASIGGLVFIFAKGSYGGRQADYAFATYGFIFLACGILTFRYAIKRDFRLHKLWAWRLYSLALASWMYRFDYYLWKVLAGHYNTWLSYPNFQGPFDKFENWAFYVPNLIVVEIVFRWGESNDLPTKWARILDACYYITFVVVVVYTIQAFFQLWLPSIIGTYQGGWII